MISDVNLLIVGNGLDLMLGLPTSYDDFHTALELTKELKSTGNVNVKTLFEEFQTKCNVPGDFGDYSEQSIKGFAEKVIEYVKKGNYFIEYFSSCQHNEWFQIEKEIGRIGLAYSFLMDHLLEMNVQSYTIDVPNDKLALMDVFEKVSDYAGIIVAVNNFRAPEENSMRIVLDINFHDGEWSIANINDKVSKLGEKLVSDLEDFKKLFVLYLRAFVQYKKVKDVSLLLKPKRIIDYNYTKTSSWMFRVGDRNINHIHGTLINLPDGPIVLGTSAANLRDDLLLFNKYIQDVAYDSDYIGFSDFLTKSDDQNDSMLVIAFFGHSLDYADKDSLSHIFKLNAKFFVFCHSQTDKTRKVVNLTKILGKETLLNMIRDGLIIFLSDKLVIKNKEASK